AAGEVVGELGGDAGSLDGEAVLFVAAVGDVEVLRAGGKGVGDADLVVEKLHLGERCGGRRQRRRRGGCARTHRRRRRLRRRVLGSILRLVARAGGEQQRDGDGEKRFHGFLTVAVVWVGVATEAVVVPCGP